MSALLPRTQLAVFVEWFCGLHVQGQTPENFFVSAGFALTHPSSVTDITAIEAVRLEELDESAVGDSNAVCTLKVCPAILSRSACLEYLMLDQVLLLYRLRSYSFFKLDLRGAHIALLVVNSCDHCALNERGLCYFTLHYRYTPQCCR